MFTMDSLVFLAIAVAILFAAVQRGGDGARTMSEKTHRAICGAAIAAGVLVRLARLTSLPAGISAEEALVGVQAKALWQTGGFLFGQGLTTQLSQWAGETTGPLLAVLTAPFVGLFGMSKLTVRLPLALLSCAAMPAAYGLGEALSGRRAARWMLLIAALCPIFVLEARMTCGSCAALYLLPIALCLIARGVTKPAALYPGMIVLALTVTFCCMKTAIGLVTACADTFCEMFPRSLRYRNWAIVFTAFSLLVSNIGLSKIISFSAPVLYFLYPLAIMLILLNIFGRYFNYARPVFVCAIGCTLVAAVFDLLKVAGLAQGVVDWVGTWLPFYSLGLGWVVPGAVGTLVGLVAAKAGGKTV